MVRDTGIWCRLKCLSVCIVLTCCGSSNTLDIADARPPLPRPEHALLVDDVLNIAHRGGALLAPEETMAAYEIAVGSNAAVLEMDAQITSDGVVVLMHDLEVDRTTDGSGRVSEMTYAQLKNLDAGYWFTQDGGSSYPYRGMGVSVPTLLEVLQAFPTMLFAIEIKNASASDAVLEVIEAAGVSKQVIVASFIDAATRRVRSLRPDILTAMSVEESLVFARMTSEEEVLYRPPTWVLQTPPSFGDLIVDSELIERANRFGIKVHVWTINEPNEMQNFLDMGVNAIMTDDPATLDTLL